MNCKVVSKPAGTTNLCSSGFEVLFDRLESKLVGKSEELGDGEREWQGAGMVGELEREWPRSANVGAKSESD